MIAYDNFSNATPGGGNLSWTHTPVGAPVDEAIDAIWNWGVANTNELAASLPEPFRSRMNAEQKYLLLCLMAAEQASGLITISPPEAA